MENKPLISVLLPVYNCELYIKEAVDSILNQTHTNFELIIIDDCSTDATVSILKTYKDSRINLIIKPKNSGYTDSLNFGIEIAKGDYIARMDGDDISLPERFEKQVNFLENNLDVVLCGTSYRIIGSGKIIHVPENHEDIQHALLEYSAFGHPTVMMRKSTLDKLPFVYNVEKEPAEDYELWVRLLFAGKLHNLQEVLLEYRIHENQVSSFRSEKQKLISIDIKFDLLKNVNYIFSEKEEILYKKCVSDSENINFSELINFISLLSNLKNLKNYKYFEEQKFIVFLRNLEIKIINRYFINRKNFRPIIYLHYRKVKFFLDKKLTLENEFKLLIKSSIFFSSE